MKIKNIFKLMFEPYIVKGDCNMVF